MSFKDRIDVLLSEWTVYEPGYARSNDKEWPVDFYAVENPEGIMVAYFLNEIDAYRFRLAEINRALNG